MFLLKVKDLFILGESVTRDKEENNKETKEEGGKEKDEKGYEKKGMALSGWQRQHHCSSLSSGSNRSGIGSSL